MAKIIKREPSLLSSQLLQAELENLIELDEPHEMQLSLHILTAKNLPTSSLPKVQRQLKFQIEGQIYETKAYNCEGSSQTAKFNETHLISIKSADSMLKIVYLEGENSNKPIGGLILRLSGFADQKRHDGWYDLGCGKLRLAIRFIFNVCELYKCLLRDLNSRIHHTETKIKPENKAVTINFEGFYRNLRQNMMEKIRKEARVCRFFMDCQARKIQQAMRKYRENFEISERSGLSEESLDECVLSQEKKSVFEENSENYDKTEMQFDTSFGYDATPYLEAVNKTFKERIKIKRY
jgi:hypothetical protein